MVVHQQFVRQPRATRAALVHITFTSSCDYISGKIGFSRAVANSANLR